MSRAHAKPSRATVMAAVEIVAQEHGVSVNAVCGLDRTAAVSKARHRVWRLLHEAGCTPSAIARAWGCNSSTVQTALKPTPSKLRRSKMARSIIAVWPALSAKLEERAR